MNVMAIVCAHFCQLLNLPLIHIMRFLYEIRGFQLSTGRGREAMCTSLGEAKSWAGSSHEHTYTGTFFRASVMHVKRGRRAHPPCLKKKVKRAGEKGQGASLEAVWASRRWICP
ncbi:hypothetical protein GOP47_0005747 [Adiantum capillus-veneris]|uniref:Uncharacterized protein n=1 Tax=Adiantum capillus-veneris TaxID=13818 RepID=A0A9D4V6V4_ADICA|nr:hypothetical protein GOP47_0005747 [Adiantum capillus-veneris]